MDCFPNTIFQVLLLLVLRSYQYNIHDLKTQGDESFQFVQIGNPKRGEKMCVCFPFSSNCIFTSETEIYLDVHGT